MENKYGPVASTKPKIPVDCIVTGTEKSQKLEEAIGLIYKSIELKKELIVTLSAMSVLEKKFPGTNVNIGEALTLQHIGEIIKSATSFYSFGKKVEEIVGWRMSEIRRLTGWEIHDRKAMWAIMSAMMFLPSIKRFFEDGEVKDET